MHDILKVLVYMYEVNKSIPFLFVGGIMMLTAGIFIGLVWIY